MTYLQNETNKIRFSQLLRVASFMNEKIIQESATDSEFQYWDNDMYAECYFDFCRCESCMERTTKKDYSESRSKFRKAKAKWLTLCYNYPIFRKFTLAQIITLSDLYQSITGYSSYSQYKYRFSGKMVFNAESIEAIIRMANFNEHELQAELNNKTAFRKEVYLIKELREVHTFIAPHEYINDSIAAQIYITALQDKPARAQTLAEARQKYAEYRKSYHPEQRIFFPTANGSSDLE